MAYVGEAVAPPPERERERERERESHLSPAGGDKWERLRLRRSRKKPYNFRGASGTPNGDCDPIPHPTDYSAPTPRRNPKRSITRRLMQDFQPIQGVAGRIFGGGEDLRRLRGYPAATTQQPPTKCPRCDSTNTKFCYYNNYNLSQPRHFCKACRRYWTKGGVLRNVPVGGGCRKTKRSSSLSSSKTSKSSAAGGDRDSPRPSAPQSSSDDCSLTGPTTEASTSTSASPSFPDSTLFASSLPKPPFHPPPQRVGLDTLGHQTPEIFPEAVGANSFTGLMPTAATSPAVLGFNFSDPPPIRLRPQPSPPKAAATVQEEIRMPGIMDQTAPVDLPPFQGRSGGGDGHTGLEWPASVDPSLFDLTSAVDPGAYWNQSQWGDADPSLYLP